MKVEAGKTYVSVDGMAHGPMKMISRKPSIFVVEGSLKPEWDEHGKVYFSSDRLDLVAERKRPALWTSMTDAEKGAILLAKYDGKEIEGFSYVRGWVSHKGSFSHARAYRIKPEPVRETVELVNFHESARGYCITFTTTDGEPDLSSIKMEKM